MRLRSVHDVNEVAMRRKWFKGSLATWDEGIWSMERVCCRNAGWLISDVTVQYHGTLAVACAGPNIEPSPKMSHVARSGSGRECHSSTILIQRLVRILTLHRRKSTAHRHSHRSSHRSHSQVRRRRSLAYHGPWILDAMPHGTAVVAVLCKAVQGLYSCSAGVACMGSVSNGSTVAAAPPLDVRAVGAHPQ